MRTGGEGRGAEAVWKFSENSSKMDQANGPKLGVQIMIRWECNAKRNAPSLRTAWLSIPWILGSTVIQNLGVNIFR